MHYLYSVYFLKIRYDENNLDVYEWFILHKLPFADYFKMLNRVSRTAFRTM